MKPHAFHPEAAGEYADAANYYAQIKDEIVNQVRQARERHAAKLNYDLKAIVADARKRQKDSGHPVVSFAPKSKKRI